VASRIEKIGYLEHIDYEVRQLRHAYSRLFIPQDQLDWNSFLESFAVHARLLIKFFCNEVDAPNFKASDYAKAYRPTSKSDHGVLTKLDEQIFHLAKNRKSESGDKVNTKRTETLFEWIEAALRQFEATLDDAYRPGWMALKEADARLVLKMEASPPSATNHIVIGTVTCTESAITVAPKQTSRPWATSGSILRLDSRLAREARDKAGCCTLHSIAAPCHRQSSCIA
jgi:hypothetical protein